jgi:predicted nucleotidyltransferase
MLLARRKAKKQGDGARDFKHTGKEYAAKKAGGDVKAKGQKLEPFA